MAATDPAAERTALAHTRTNKALVRTRLAHERTLMAWIRTATSLITFGFSIYTFFDFLRESIPATTSHQLLGPRGFALVMISLGVVALVLATWEYRAQMKELGAQYGENGPLPHSLSAAVAVVVAAFGVLSLLLVFFRQ